MRIKKMKIKNNKRNIFYMIIGRVATFILLYAIMLQVSIKILLYIVDNCITTL